MMLVIACSHSRQRLPAMEPESSITKMVSNVDKKENGSSVEVSVLFL